MSSCCTASRITYTWRAQMPELAKHFRVVAIDQRGYNKSDQPNGVENYRIEKLVGDVKAVIEHFGETSATIVGHDGVATSPGISPCVIPK